MPAHCGTVSSRIIFDVDWVGPWVCDRTGGSFSKSDSAAIGLTNPTTDDLIAGVLFDGWNGRSICMHVAAVPGARWMTREFLWVCFDYPFNQINVSKIVGLVDSTNAPARKFDEHLGFIQEATIKDAGKVGDLLIYTMTRQQCRFLEMGEKYGRKSLRTAPA
jgi:hypothetical protein